MRIISGKYKRRRFDVPKKFKLRPTTDFAKENLFNVLSNIIDFEEMTALDLFAGTGSISIELASRGCKKVISIEKVPAHCSFIKSVVKQLEAPIFPLRSDALTYLSKQSNTPFDFIFADPPYALKEMNEIPDLVFNNNLLKPGAFFILEHSRENDFSKNPNFIDHRKYGSVNFSIFQRPFVEE